MNSKVLELTNITWIDAARLSSVFAVVLLHSAAQVVVGAEFGQAHWWAGNIYDGITRWCVPVFVMISGALLLSSSSDESLHTFYSKRLSRILIPLLAWTIIYILWDYLKGYSSDPNFDIPKYVDRIVAGRPHYHLWYLYMIVSLYAFTPFIRKLVHICTSTELWIFVGLSFLIAILNQMYGLIGSSTKPTMFLGWFLMYVPYYISGYLIFKSPNLIPKFVAVSVFVISVLVTIVGTYYLIDMMGMPKGLYLYRYLSITVVPMSLSALYLFKFADSSFPFSQRLSRLAPLSFGVYLIHPIFMDLTQKFVGNPTNTFPAITIPFVALVSFGLSLYFSGLIGRTPYLRRII